MENNYRIGRTGIQARGWPRTIEDLFSGFTQPRCGSDNWIGAGLRSLLPLLRGLRRHPSDIGFGEGEPAAEGLGIDRGRIDPEEALHGAALHDERAAAGQALRGGLTVRADAEHEAVLAGAAEHVVAEEEADAAEHLLLAERGGGNVRGRAEAAADLVRQCRHVLLAF